MIDKGCIFSIIFGLALLLIVGLCEAISKALEISAFVAFILLLSTFVFFAYLFVAVIEKNEKNKSDKEARIKRMYPRAYNQFVNENRNIKEHMLQNAILSREECLWDIEENKLIKEESKNRELSRLFQEIIKTYPNGFLIYKSKHPRWMPDDIRN